jgi:hypothetical protein
MNIWHKFPNEPPDCDEPVLCLLNNGQQVTLALDESKGEWSLYEDRMLEDAIVIGWRELESKEKIEEQLGIKKEIDVQEIKFIRLDLSGISQKP